MSARLAPPCATWQASHPATLSPFPPPAAVLKAPGLFLVEFYAPWCGHCKNLAPEWKKAAKALKGIVSVVAVDADASKSLAGKYGVQGFPTIKLFGESKSSPEDYSGARDAAGIVTWAMGKATAVAKARLSGKASGGSKGSSGGSGSGSGSGSKPKGGSSGGGKGGSAVVTLTPDNFDAEVFSGETPWMVEFFAPWCGHCKNLAPEWASAAEQTAGENVRFGAVDADAHRELGSRFGVKGFPTIKTFAAGAKKDSDARDYNGPREAGGLVEAALKLAESAGPSKATLTQVTSAAAWADACGSKRICLTVVLPHILDDGAERRNARLAVLSEVAGKLRGKPIRCVWWEAGQHEKMEAALGGVMAPQAFAVASDKGAFSVHKGAVDAKSLGAFASGLTGAKGAAGTSPFPKGFDIAAAFGTVQPWDGKDGQAPVEEPLDL